MLLQGQILQGLGFLLFGLVFILLVWVLLRFVPRVRPSVQEPAQIPFAQIQSHADAVLLIETGGRVRFINKIASEWFELADGETPNIERLSRRVRPGEGFLEICAAEGQARFSVNGKLVDGVSYHVPGPLPAVLLALRRAENVLNLAESGQDSLPATALRSISDFGQAIASSLSLEATIESILTNVEQLVASDFIEVKIWEETTQVLTPYQLEGTPGLARALKREKQSQFGEYANYLVTSREELFIADTRKMSDEKYDPVNHRVPPMGSYLGIPLVAYGQLVGTLEVGVVPVNGFTVDDLSILQLVTGQAAVALRNAGLYEAQQRWNAQLFGLTNLSQAVGSLHDLKDLFARMVDGLSTLFNVDILGFLLYDEQRRLLEGQMPFQGLPNNIVQIYKTPISFNSPAEKHILSQEIIKTANAAQDSAWVDLGLQDIAQAASMRDTALIPLISSGRFLGYLQLSNHRQSEDTVSEEELRLLKIVANQVAAIIDNALLVQQARQRNQRTEGMRRIASLVSSTATLDEILKYSLQEVAQLLQADSGSIFLLDESAGIMRAHVPSAFGVPDELRESLSRLNVKSSAFRMTVAGSQRPFVSGELAKDNRVLPLYRIIVRKLKMESAMVVPLVVRGQGIGELMVGSRKQDLFNNYDLQIASTVASQLAIAIDSSQHSGETDEILRRRSTYLTVTNRIVRELNSTSNLKEISRIIHDECLAVTGAACGAVFLYDREKDGIGNRTVLYFQGHSPTDTPSDLEQKALEMDEPLVISDVPDDEVPHSGIHSALLMPIINHGQVFGLIQLHSAKVDHFDETAAEMVKNISAQAALSVNQAFRQQDQQQRIELFHRRADTLMQLFETSKNLRVDQTLTSAMDSIAQGIQKATPFEVVMVSLYDAQTGLLSRVVGAGIDETTFAEFKTYQQPWTSISQLMKPEFEVGNVFFIPADQAPVIPGDVQLLTTMTEAQQKPNAWDPDDLLLIPIYDNHDNPLGLISVDVPRDGLRPDQVVFETLEVFAAQAALTITSGLSILDFRSQIDSLSDDVQRQKSLVDFSQRSLPMLLHKDLEQTISISHLNQRARHIRASLQLTEAISRQVDSSTALITLGQQVLTSFDMSVAILARDTIEGPRITNILGSLPRGANPEALFGQRNPLRTCLQTGEAILSENLDEDEVWHDTPFLSALHAKSFICMPVVINNKPIAAVLATDTEPIPGLSPEDRKVYFQISKQISIILQNISLLNETRQRLQEVNLLLDFSRRLSGLNPQEILKSLLDSALRVVSPAHAGVVFLWEPHDELLVPSAAANYVDDETIMEIRYHAGEGLPGRVFNERKSLRVDDLNFAADYNLPAENLLKFRKATGGRLPVSSMVLPISTSERQLGILILDNFNASAAFQADDEAILLSLIQQVALSLENVRLVQATQERAGQLQALNAVAATLTSSLQRDELVGSLLERMTAVIPYDTAILWLRQEDKMVVADARGFDDSEERKGLSVEVADSVLLNEMTRTGQAIAADDIRSDPRFTQLVEPRYLSWLGIPLITKGQVIGVLAIEKTESHFYSRDLMQLATTFASQAAVAIDNANLFEESVRRAAELDERSQRLALLNQFSSALGGSLSADQVLRLTANQLMAAVQADRAMVLLLDKNNRDFLLTILPDETGQVAGYRSLPASPALNRLRESQTIYFAENINQDASLDSLANLLGGMTSLFILPIPCTENLYAIAIQSQQEHRFTSTEIELSRTIGNQAAIALENADLYQSTVATAERLAILNQVSYEIGSSLDIEDIYRSVHDAAGKLMPVEAFIIAFLDEETDEVDGVYIVDLGQRISNIRLPSGQGLSGQVIATGQPILTTQSSEVDARGGVPVGEKGTPHSIVAVPMLSGGKVIGCLSAQSYQHYAYTENDQQILSTLANQATVAIQNARLLGETQKLAATLEQRVVERTAELAHEQHNTETLLRILTEVSASLDLDRALSRTLALLNDAIGAEQGTIMLLHAEDNMLHYRAGYGYVSEVTAQPGDIKPANELKLKIGEGLAGWVVKNRQPVMVDDLYQDSRWVVSHGSKSHRSALVAPLVVGEDIIGAIMVYHRQAGFFSDDALEMVKAIGAQVAIAINNAQLYELIRDQAERLGSMLRQQQMEASRQTAILEAVADGVLVTDPTNQITFVNASAEQILSLSESQLQGQSLENFSGLFGKSTQTWIQTVQEWSDNPGANRSGEMYAEQFSLENGRVVLVHLAPVVWRKEFLGTVSIFRDITHEVEVDRLKSEFVATVSHELRTPMTSIRGYVDILLMGAAGALNENQTHFLEIVKNNTERLNILVNDLLDVSRIEAGRITLSLHPLDLREVADEVIADVLRRSQEEGKPMEVSLDAGESLPHVVADPERVRQILGNLVDNAYNYTPSQGNIKVSMHSANGNVQVDVIDSGIGISLEQQERVFERFFRGEDPLVLATPGTGLGLSIVKQLVEMHHGKIWMNSNGMPGRGSTFSFTLPVADTEE
jgi:PAS domain S-box-containing protein